MHTIAASQERRLLMEFWDMGVMMAKAQTSDLSAAAKATGLWQAGSRLRELKASYSFVEYSHRSLNFSRCTGFPYTHDIPVIDPRQDETYRVLRWHDRSADGPAIGEADNPCDAVALVIDHLPDECGPAVAGTADDF